MPDLLTLTKSSTSRISRPQTRSPLKKAPIPKLSRRIADVPPTDATAVPLEVTHSHVPAGTSLYPLARLTVDASLVFNDVLSGIKFLTEILFPAFPSRGLSRDRIAELYAARRVIAPGSGTDVGCSSDGDDVATSLCVHESYRN
jgi:hypothetical protein